MKLSLARSLKRAAVVLSVVGVAVGAAAGAHAIWAYFDAKGSAAARIDIADTRVKGSKIEFLLFNPGSTSVLLNRVAFFITKYQKLGYAVPSSTGPLPIPALYSVTFPLGPTADQVIEVDTSFTIAAGESGAFSIDVKVPSVSRGAERATHAYETVAVLFYNVNQRVSTSSFAVTTSSAVRVKGGGNPLKPTNRAAPLPGAAQFP